MKNFKLSTKILGMLIVTLAIMSASGGLGIVFMNRIGAGITEIANKNIPLIEVVTKLESQHLEQAINFERALRYGIQALTHSDEILKNVEAAKKTFEALNGNIGEELKKAKSVTGEAGDGTVAAEAKITNFQYHLKQIEEGQAQYYGHVLGVFAMIGDGRISESLEDAEVAEKESEELNDQFKAFLISIEKFTEASVLKAEQDERTALVAVVASILAGIVLALVMGISIIRTITKPIGQMVEVVQKLGQGDLTSRLHLNRKDEIGVMANEIDRFAEGLAGLVTEIRGSSDQVSDSSISLTDIANALAAGSEQNAIQANNVSSETEQLNSNVTSVASAVEEMSATIKEIMGSVIKSSQITQTAVERSTGAAEIIRAVSESSDSIGKITELIRSIADQTNILALNATIEAARAGDAGKGFAVVASEVKGLANEISRATGEIVSQIGDMQANAKDAVTAMDEIGSILAEVNSHAVSVSSAIEEQSSTTSEIARYMNEASTGVKNIVSNVSGVADSAQENSRKSTETKSAADVLTSVAARLVELVATFKTGNGAHGGQVEMPNHSEPLPESETQVLSHDPLEELYKPDREQL